LRTSEGEDWPWSLPLSWIQEASLRGAGKKLDEGVDDDDDDDDDDEEEKEEEYREFDETWAADFFSEAAIAPAEPCSDTSLHMSVMPLPLFLLLELEPWEDPFKLESVERLSSLADSRAPTRRASESVLAPGERWWLSASSLHCICCTAAQRGQSDIVHVWYRLWMASLLVQLNSSMQVRNSDMASDLKDA